MSQKHCITFHRIIYYLDTYIFVCFVPGYRKKKNNFTGNLFIVLLEKSRRKIDGKAKMIFLHK